MEESSRNIQKSDSADWPSLPLQDWEDTCTSLHMWTQIVGKIRLELTPQINHWWNVPLYVSARGLTTSTIPYGARIFEMEFNFLEHQLDIFTGEGERRKVALAPRTVADFYQDTMSALAALGIDVKIWTVPVEVEERIAFEQDTKHSAYDAAYAHRFWRTLVQADRVLKEFRARFTGKSSPVHFFWGSFDLAVTRFSGREAPPHPGVENVAKYVMEEAYSLEQVAAGFWPGKGLGEPAFYTYAYPEPEGFQDYPVQPEAAYYSQNLREFLLPYEAVRTAESPDDTLMTFLQSAYAAAADTGGWDRLGLEQPPAG